MIITLHLKRASVIVAVVALSSATAMSSALADVFKNAVAPNGVGVGGAKNVTLPAGGGAATAAIPYYIDETGNSCDAADGSQATGTIQVPAGVSATPSSLEFTFASQGKFTDPERTA